MVAALGPQQTVSRGAHANERRVVGSAVEMRYQSGDFVHVDTIGTGRRRDADTASAPAQVHRSQSNHSHLAITSTWAHPFSSRLVSE